jgi:hypothetical protein
MERVDALEIQIKELMTYHIGTKGTATIISKTSSCGFSNSGPLQPENIEHRAAHLMAKPQGTLLESWFNFDSRNDLGQLRLITKQPVMKAG